MANYGKTFTKYADMGFWKYLVYQVYTPISIKQYARSWSWIQNEKIISEELKKQSVNLKNVSESVQCVKNAKLASTDDLKNSKAKLMKAVSQLAPERKEKMEKSLDHVSLTINVDKVEQNAVINMGFTKKSISLRSQVDLNIAIQKQTECIVLRAILLMLETAGVDVDVSMLDSDRACCYLWKQFDNELERVVEQVPTDHENLPAVVLGFFQIVFEAYRSGIFWNIVRVFVTQRISDSDHIKIITKITAFIMTLVTIDGFTEIAEAVANLGKGEALLEMLKNLKYFHEELSIKRSF